MNKPQNARRPRGRGAKRNKTSGGGNGGNRMDNRSRGNPKQLLDKYKTQARDALQSGDRVLAEYYYQFADHYQRIVNERYGVSIVEEDDADFDEDEDEESAQGHEARQPSRTERAEAAEAERRRALRRDDVPSNGEARQRGGESDDGAGSGDGETDQGTRGRRRRRGRHDRTNEPRPAQPACESPAQVVDVVDNGAGDGGHPLVVLTEIDTAEQEPKKTRRRRQPSEPAA
ncbi:MAG: hypothetical protein Kow00104_14250 [Rhodothalassiaceae bacterium]